MAWYRIGTVALTNGSKEVTGDGTQFLNNVKAGDIFIGPDGLLYEIASVDTSAQLNLQIVYAGPTVAGATYEIVPTTINLKQLAQRVADLIALYNEIPDDVKGSQDAAVVAASAAAASAQAAGTSEVNAAASGETASAAAAQLAAALLTFNKLWLGPHGTDPSTDNSGAALQEGAMYENTSTTPAKIRIYHNGEWQNYSADAEAAMAAAQLSAANAAASESNAASSASAAATSASEASDSASAAATSAEVAQNATDDKMGKSANLSDVADVPTARANLGAAASGPNTDITEITGLTTALSVGQGGTGLNAAGQVGQVLGATGSGNPLAWRNTSDCTLLFGVLGSSSPSAAFSRYPCSSGAGKFRLVVSYGVLSRPNSPLGPVVLTNFDGELDFTAGVGPLKSDGSIPASTATPVAVFLLWDDSQTGNPTIVGGTGKTPVLTDTSLSGYKYWQLVYVNDILNLSSGWAQAAKLIGGNVYYPIQRTLANAAINSGQSVSVSFYNNWRDVVVEFDFEMFLSMVVPASDYGETQLWLDTFGYTGTLQGSSLRATAILYTRAGQETQYSSARGRVAGVAGTGSWQVNRTQSSGNVIATNFALYCYGYRINNNAVN